MSDTARHGGARDAPLKPDGRHCAAAYSRPVSSIT